MAAFKFAITVLMENERVIGYGGYLLCWSITNFCAMDKKTVLPSIFVDFLSYINTKFTTPRHHRYESFPNMAIYSALFVNGNK